MKHYFFSSLMLIVMITSSVYGAFEHPGIFSTKKELDFVKQKIKEGKEPWKVINKEIIQTPTEC